MTDPGAILGVDDDPEKISEPRAIFPRSLLPTPLRKTHAEAKGVAQVVDIYS
jgi:hypothetical protein